VASSSARLCIVSPIILQLTWLLERCGIDSSCFAELWQTALSKYCSYVKKALAGVVNILSYLKAIPADSDLHEQCGVDRLDTEAVKEQPVICSRSFWIYSKVGVSARKAAAIVAFFHVFGNAPRDLVWFH
jgi:hypothetical protein